MTAQQLLARYKEINGINSLYQRYQARLREYMPDQREEVRNKIAISLAIIDPKPLNMLEVLKAFNEYKAPEYSGMPQIPIGNTLSIKECVSGEFFLGRVLEEAKRDEELDCYTIKVYMPSLNNIIVEVEFNGQEWELPDGFASTNLDDYEKHKPHI